MNVLQNLINSVEEKQLSVDRGKMSVEKKIPDCNFDVHFSERTLADKIYIESRRKDISGVNFDSKAVCIVKKSHLFANLDEMISRVSEKYEVTCNKNPRPLSSDIELIFTNAPPSMVGQACSVLGRATSEFKLNVNIRGTQFMMFKELQDQKYFEN